MPAPDWTFISSSHDSFTGVTTRELTLPTDVQLGDVIFLLFTAFVSAGTSARTLPEDTFINVTYEVGIERKLSSYASSGNAAHLMYRVVDGDEPATVNIGTPILTMRGDASFFVYRPQNGYIFTGFPETPLILDNGLNVQTGVRIFSADTPNAVLSSANVLAIWVETRDFTWQEGAASGELRFQNGEIALYDGVFEPDSYLEIRSAYLASTTFAGSGFLALLEVGLLATPSPELDAPVRVALSENVQGPEVETGISVTYLANHSIRRNIGQKSAIDDEIQVGSTLYDFWVRTREINGGLVTYQGETLLGRLNSKTQYTPSSIARIGPFTGRQAFIFMLEFFKADGASWLTWDASQIPEFAIQTSEGLIIPTIKGLNFKQGNATAGEATYSAMDWLERLTLLFADEYKIRQNSAGDLVVAAPYYASNQFDLVINFPVTPETIVGPFTGYIREFQFNSSAAAVAINVRKRGESTFYALNFDAVAGTGYTFSDAAFDYNVGFLLSPSGFVRISVTDIVSAEDFLVTGSITGTNAQSITFSTLYDEQIKMLNETRTFDLNWLYFEAEAISRPLEYAAGSEVFDPAYIDHEPLDRLPTTPDRLGNVFFRSGLFIRNFQAPNQYELYRGWLPAAPVGRSEVVNVWPIQDGSLVDINDEIEITAVLDFYWSRAATYDGDAERYHYDAEAWADDVGFTYKMYTASDWADAYDAPPLEPLPYTFPTIRIPLDGRKSRIRWRISKSLSIFEGSQQGICSGDIAFSYRDGNIYVEKENYFQYAVFGGIHAWIVAPRLTLNATASVLTEGDTEVRAVWGDTSEHEAALPALAAAKLAYPDRPRKVIDATNFDLSLEELLAICEAFVRRRHAGAEIITYEQLAPYPVRPDDLNKLYDLPQNEYGVLIDWSYNESHTPARSESSSALKFRKELALAAGLSDSGVYWGADDSEAGDDAYWNDSYWNDSGPVVDEYVEPTVPAVPSDPQTPQDPISVPNRPSGPYTYTVSTLAALAALDVKAGESVYILAGTDTSIVTDSVFLTLQGTSDKPISVVFDDGYTLDSSGSSAGTNDKPWFLNCRNLNVWGGLHRRSPTYGWYFDGNSDCNFYGMRSFESYIDGFNLYKANRRLRFYYCTAYGGYNGPDADGFYLHWESNEDNEFINCDAGFNSDDGFDLWRSTRTTLRNCRAHNNGTSYQGSTGDGNGFKLGSGSTVGAGGAVAVNCKSWDNGAGGFDWNSSPAPISLTGCVGWSNNRNFDLSALTTTSGCYSSEGTIADSHKANSAAGVTTIAAAGFVSTDPTNAEFLEVL